MRKALTVPVLGALVTASYGGLTDQVLTNDAGAYGISFDSNAVLNRIVRISVTAQSSQQIKGQSAFVVRARNSASPIVSSDLDDTVTNAGSFIDLSNDLTLNYNTDPVASASFAAFSMLQADYEAATGGLENPGLGARLTSPLRVIVLPGSPPPSGNIPPGAYYSATKTIGIYTNAIANTPDVLSHEFGHYVASMGNFLAPAVDKGTSSITIFGPMASRIQVRCCLWIVWSWRLMKAGQTISPSLCPSWSIPPGLTSRNSTTRY